MNRKYIDFVPVNNTAEAKTSARAVVRTTALVETVEETPIDELIEAPIEEPIEAIIEMPVEAPVRAPRRAPVRQARPVRQVRPAKQLRLASQPRPTSRPRPVSQPMPVPEPRPAMVTRTAVAAKPAVGGPALGVVEDLNTHFVNTNVPKRSLGEKPVRPVQRPVQSARLTQPTATELKAQKVKAGLSAKSIAVTAKKPTPKPTQKMGLSKEKSTYKAPKPTFINQNKVVKRPLSNAGNVYHKQSSAKAAKEEKKGPVTIIQKPEKEKHIGIIVTIIITIILGAAAGTVAFLLLPK